MSESKPSGIRPPTKIGRPCSTMPPRPAIPPSPLRPTTNQQMEPIWESQSRRTNETVLRRGSDTSVVLTEDTDSFIIGDRVWVGGTKPGAIAYIGETQFAPGDWAGVVLDEPIGKNDGSVAGCRYFQCEPKRGIFSRLTRLTREPLTTITSSVHRNFGLASPETPTKLTGSLTKSTSPSLNASTTSLSSMVSQRDVPKIGERVIVSSSQGSKTGVLRFTGIAEFAPGEWCGIELDDAVGKNDGSVEGKRYFECRPKHGLFAPIHKISRSPSNKKSLGSIYKPTGAALNSSLRKTGSRESLMSVTSIASTAASVAMSARGGVGSITSRRPGVRTPVTPRSSLQETLREKMQEIDILRQQRDMERERVTKAANQADQAEQSTVVLKQEYDKYRESVRNTIQNTEIELAKLTEEKNHLLVQLEEEKRKSEDLLFRFEEESINKDGIEVTNTLNENKIKELEKQLAEERERVIQLERDNIKLFETEEELTKLHNEISTLSNKDSSKVDQRIKELELRLTGKEEECVKFEKMKLNLEKLLDDKKIEKEVFDKLTKESEEYKKLLEDKNNIIKTKSDELDKYLQLQKITLEEMKTESVKRVNEISESYDRRLSAKDGEMNELSLKLYSKTEEMDKLMKELTNQQNLYKQKEEELKIALDKIEELNAKLLLAEENNLTLASQINEVQSKCNDSVKVIQEKQKLEQDVVSLMATATESAQLVDQLNLALEAKNKELEQFKLNSERQINELTERFEKEIQEKNKFMKEINEDVSRKNLLLQTMEREINELKSIIASKDEEIKHLFNKNTDLQDSLNLFEQTRKNLEKDLQANERRIEELTQNLTRTEEKFEQTTIQKEKLESDIEKIINTSTDSSEQLKQYNEDLRNKEKEFEALQEKQFQTERNLNSAKEELDKTTVTLKQVQLNVEDINSQLDKEKKINIELENKKFELSNTLEERLKTLDKLQSEQSALRWSVEETNEKLTSLDKENNELKTNLQTRDSKIEELEKQIEQLKTESTVTRDNEIIELSKKKSLLEETANSLQMEMEKLRIDYNEKLKDNLKTIQDLTVSFEREKNQLADRNNALENEEQNLREILAKKTIEFNEITLKLKTMDSLDIMKKEIDEMNLEKQLLSRTKDGLEKLLEEREIQINTLNDTIKSRDKESERNMQNLMEKLNLVSSESAKLLDSKTRLENENKQIKANWIEPQNRVTKNNLNVEAGNAKETAVENNTDYLKLREEYETAQSQINFLNSMIVDMQSKIETLVCKIQVLEMGIPPDEADDYSRNTIDKRIPAPRMFCDICDQFDLHETEDCPQQAQDFQLAEKITNDSNKKKFVDRPYCENCEVFGHHTRDCDDAETF